MNLKDLRQQIIVANQLYRAGEAILSDMEYDNLIDELSILSPNDELLKKVGFEISDDRKERLDIIMASMNKVKYLSEIFDWCRLRGIPMDTEVVLMPKFDGISLEVKESNKRAHTRGDGVFGQRSDNHYKSLKKGDGYDNIFEYTIGEVMMPKKTFLEKYSQDFANPRNLVAGLLNSKEATEPLEDCVFIRYGFDTILKNEYWSDVTTKSQVLDILNSKQYVDNDIFVNYDLIEINELTEEYLAKLFKSWSENFEIDGIIIEVNDLNLQEKLGRETSTKNPVWARAYKSPDFEQTATTKVNGISWNISKQGYLKPTIHVDTVNLDGVNVSNVTGNNARFVKDMGIGVGSIIKIKRSGMVIPLIVEVIEKMDFQMPDVKDIKWNDNGIELMTIYETDDQRIKKLISFFDTLETKNVSEGVITQLWEAGYKTVKDILNLLPSDMEKLDGFGKRKSNIVYDSIQKSIYGVELSKVQHASGLFWGLGSRKLKLLEHFDTKPTVDEVMKIDGFAEISAKSYVDSYDAFKEFVQDLPIKINIEKITKEDMGTNDLEGKTFVFTGVRLHDAENVIVSRGGKIGSGVSKSTRWVVCKDVNSGSAKLEKAKSLGVEIIDVQQLNDMLGI